MSLWSSGGHLSCSNLASSNLEIPIPERHVTVVQGTGGGNWGQHSIYILQATI